MSSNKTFKQAAASTPARSFTLNGALTNASSANPCVDLFFAIGSSRGKDISRQFAAAFGSNPEVATRILLWARDVREGAGERDTFRKLLSYLEHNAPETLERVIPAIPFFGRWDDLLVFQLTASKDIAYSVIARGLEEGNGLCAKWMPRKGEVAVELRTWLGMTPKRYRKMLVGLTDVVEQKMCAKLWDKIDFGKLPSIASSRYTKAFNKRATAAYQEYKAKLVKGEAKINAGAIYPYDVLKNVGYGDSIIAREQWKALPNYLGDDKIIPMVDVSGSMTCSVGGNGNLTCMDVAVSLGLYIADKQEGTFKDMFLTFSSSPELLELKGDILQKMKQMKRSSWGMSTNVIGGFEKILEVATRNRLAASEMPKYILILSDMEFNSCVNRGGHQTTAYDKVTELYHAAGYELPKIVFWNLNAREGNSPVTFDQNGTALVSGFSPTIVKSILGAKNFTPEAIMLETVMDSRYDLDRFAA